MTKQSRELLFRNSKSTYGGILPSISPDRKIEYHMKRSNRYLGFVERKISRLIQIDENLAGHNFERFSRKSRVGQIFILNQSEPKYFLKGNMKEVLGYLSRGIKNIRLKKFKMKMKRSYIEKEDGSLRPIGAPSQDSKHMFVCVNEFLKKGLDKGIGPYQHGFRRGRGILSASLEVRDYIMKDYKAYEFDLKGFFNGLNAEVIGRELKKRIPNLADGIRFTNRFTIPALKDINTKDKEMKFLNEINGIQKWGKSGFTQGANGSPLICIYALEIAKYREIDNLVMYADDGLIFRETEEEINQLTARKGGIKVNEEKNLGGTDLFTFLGITYDLTQKKAFYKEDSVDLKDLASFTEFIKKFGKKYRSRKIVTETTIRYGAQNNFEDGVWRSKDDGIITLLSEGTRAVVCNTGVVFRDEMSARTEANYRILQSISDFDQWNSSQRLTIKPSKRDFEEGNKLFNINVVISKDVIVQQKVS